MEAVERAGRPAWGEPSWRSRFVVRPPGGGGSPGRVRLAVVLLICVGIGWPSTAIAQALGAQLFVQVMLALSWLAPALTAVDILFTAQVHEQQESETKE